MKNNRLTVIFIVVAILLLIPFIAMQFTNEVNWSLFDFIAMGILLLSTGLLIDLVLRKITKTKQRILLIIVVIGVFLIVWAELAVGIFGTPFGGS
jgi:peptidoglycan/LPS O-acetylase OafA/YrhL